MEHLLSDEAVRVLGCFIEKEFTTPDYYPLSLNALTNACNQKSNRFPVVGFEETTVVRTLDDLRGKGLAMLSKIESSRVSKYRHTLVEKLHLRPRQLAILAELFLRGPQTLGELRSRADRMVPLEGLDVVEETLEELMAFPQPFVTKLPRQIGQKECRYAHLLSGEPQIDEDIPLEAATRTVQAENERISRLEEEVAALRGELEQLTDAFAQFRKQFD